MPKSAAFLIPLWLEEVTKVSHTIGAWVFVTLTHQGTIVPFDICKKDIWDWHLNCNPKSLHYAAGGNQLKNCNINQYTNMEAGHRLIMVLVVFYRKELLNLVMLMSDLSLSTYWSNFVILTLKAQFNKIQRSPPKILQGRTCKHLDAISKFAKIELWCMWKNWSPHTS